MNKPTNQEEKKGQKLAKEVLKWETEEEVMQAVKEGRVANVAYEDVYQDGETVQAPVGIEWPDGKKQEDCLLMVGYPLAGLHQDIETITFHDGKEVHLRRVGTYAAANCGAYEVVK